MAVATFTALQTPLLDAGTQRTSYTWQQKFIEWERKINAALPIATTIALGTVKPDGTTITITAGGVISAVGGSGAVLVPQEQIAGAGTGWTLANAPLDDTEVELYIRIAGFGGAKLFQGAGLDYTIAGTAITTSAAYSAGTVFARYHK